MYKYFALLFTMTIDEELNPSDVSFLIALRYFAIHTSDTMFLYAVSHLVSQLFLFNIYIR